MQRINSKESKIEYTTLFSLSAWHALSQVPEPGKKKEGGISPRRRNAGNITHERTSKHKASQGPDPSSK